ncbi:replicative DNA helicase [Paenibacillus sp. RC84]|uniref:replicative DNA helicase n=1 Tax=Paenibacillus sp. RC84 TaxID=3156252 RepID=UPI0035146AD0
MTQANSLLSLDSDLMAEQSVLGAVLLDNDRIDEIRFLEPRDFTGAHEMLWRVIDYLDSIDKPVDIMTVTEMYTRTEKRKEEFVQLGGVSYLSQLTSGCPSSSKAAVDSYARIVRKNGNRKRIRSLTDKIRDEVDGDYETEEEMFSAVEELVSDIRPQESGEMRSMSESRQAYKKHLTSVAERLRTGFKQYDEWSQLHRGWLYILAGRPSVGKTAKALQLAYGVAKHNPDGGVVLVFSLEMGENELKDRWVSSIAGVNYVRLTQKKEELTEDEHRRIDKALDELDGLPIYVQDKPGVTIDDIRATVRRFKKKHGKIAAVFVDYLQIMNIPQRKNEHRAQAIGKVTSTAKTLSRQYNFCFVMLSQMTRESDNGEEPKLSDLKESGSIEQDADVVEFLWHKRGDLEDNCKVVRSYFAKGRNVGENRFRYKFEWWYQRYKELDRVSGEGVLGGKKNRK